MPKYEFVMNHRVPWLRYLAYRARDWMLAQATTTPEPIQGDVQPVFIMGCGHSGTTLLAARLGLHPEIHVNRWETGAFLPNLPPFASTKLTQTLISAAEAAGARFVVEKTPKHIHAVPRIKALVPEAKLIVMIRNPLDTVASLLKRFNDLDLCIERWVMDTEAAHCLADRPDAQVIRYEDFVTEPAPTLDGLLTFLGADPVDWAAEEHRLATRYADPRNANQAIRFQQVVQPIRPNIGAHRETLSPDEITRVRDATRPLAQTLGYEPDAPSPIGTRCTT